jgi:hypothetical protein
VASEAARPVITLSSPAVSLDIDWQTDLDAYISHCMLNSAHKATETWQFLQACGYIEQVWNMQRMQQ